MSKLVRLVQLFGRQRLKRLFFDLSYFSNNVHPFISHPTHCSTPPSHQAPLCQCPAKTHLLRRLSFRGNGCWVGEECLHEVSWYLRASSSTNGRVEGITEILGCQFSSGSPSSFFSLCLFSFSSGSWVSFCLFPFVALRHQRHTGGLEEGTLGFVIWSKDAVFIVNNNSLGWDVESRLEV